MSNTSHGFIHYHEAVFLQKHGQDSNPKTWAERLPVYIKEDFEVSPHISIEPAEPLLMACEKCHRQAPAVSPHSAVSFLDAHRYCGEFKIPVWVCSKCGALEDPAHPNCRFCETSWGPYQGRKELYDFQLEQEKEFFIEREGKVTGKITAGSLREVLRAVRAWYPYELITVRCAGIGSWTTDHVCK